MNVTLPKRIPPIPVLASDFLPGLVFGGPGCLGPKVTFTSLGLFGCGSKSKTENYAGFSCWFHLQRHHVGTFV